MNKSGWAKVNLLQSQLIEIKNLIKKQSQFSNISQFVVFAIRKELDFRKNNKK